MCHVRGCGDVGDLGCSLGPSRVVIVIVLCGTDMTYSSIICDRVVLIEELMASLIDV
jgi:hypothetical protein